MGLRARKIHALSLLFILAAVFGSGAFLLAQDLSSGSHTVVKRYILPRYSNNGKLQCVIYGTQAINMVLQEMKERFGCKEVYLSTDPENAVGRHVYEKAGFRSEHRMLDDEELFKIVLE